MWSDGQDTRNYNAFIVEYGTKEILWQGYVPPSRTEEFFACDYSLEGAEGMSRFSSTAITDLSANGDSQTLHSRT
jgi:hypothetical protein